MVDRNLLRAVALMLASVVLLAASACAPSGGETASSEAASRGEAVSQSETSSAAATESKAETVSLPAADSSTATASSQEDDVTARIRGTLANGMYANAWAGFKFTLPEGMTPVDAEQLAAYENGAVLYGMMATGSAEATRMITVMFEDASANEATAEEYLSSMAEQTAGSGGNGGYDITASDLFPFTVAGKEYATVRFEVSGGTDDGASLGIRLNGGKLVQYYCMRKQDDVFISIMVSDPSEDWIKSTLGTFTAA